MDILNPHIARSLIAALAGVVALSTFVSCASSPTSKHPPPTRFIDVTADPIDPLLKSSALVVGLELDDAEIGEQAFSAFEAPIREMLSGPSTKVDPNAEARAATADDLIDALREAIFSDHITSLDREGRAFLALTPQGNPPYLNALRISRIIPLENYPRWFHIRQVVPATRGDVQLLEAELEASLEDQKGFYWHLRRRDDRVVIDFQVPLSTGADGDIRRLRDDNLDVFDRGYYRKNSAARAQFARSESPASLYVDHRRLGQILAIREASTHFVKFADHVSRWRERRLPLMPQWMRGNQAAVDIFRHFIDESATYGDATITVDRYADGLLPTVIATRTEGSVEEDSPEVVSTTQCPAAAGDDDGITPMWTFYESIDDACAFSSVISTLFDWSEAPLVAEPSEKGIYTRISAAKEAPKESEKDQKSPNSLPEIAVSIDPLPPCVLDLRRFVHRSISELQRKAPEAQYGVLDRRLLSTVERARRCQQYHPELPRLSTVLSRNLWQMGLHAEQEGRHSITATLYAEACELGDELACQYSERINRAMNVELPLVGEKRNITRPPLRFNGFVRAYISVDELERVSVGQRTIATVDELQGREAQKVLHRRLSETTLPSPLALVSADEDLRAQARGTIALAADGDFDARKVLTPFTVAPLAGQVYIHPLVKVAGVDDRRLALSTIKVQTTTTTYTSGGDPQIRVHLRDDGIDIAHDNKSIPSIEGCPRRGPTICTGDETVEGFPIPDLFAVMPALSQWVAGKGELLLVVESDVTWGLLAELSILLQNQNHPQWIGLEPARIFGFTSRAGTPYPHVTVVTK